MCWYLAYYNVLVLLPPPCGSPSLYLSLAKVGKIYRNYTHNTKYTDLCTNMHRIQNNNAKYTDLQLYLACNIDLMLIYYYATKGCGRVCTTTFDQQCTDLCTKNGCNLGHMLRKVAFLYPQVPPTLGHTLATLLVMLRKAIYTFANNHHRWLKSVPLGATKSWAILWPHACAKNRVYGNLR